MPRTHAHTHTIKPTKKTSSFNIFADAVTVTEEYIASANIREIRPALPKGAPQSPQLYIFSFPGTISQPLARQQLAIATTRPHDVTIYVSTCCIVETNNVTSLGQYVINSNSDALIVSLTGTANSSAMTVNVTSSDKINLYAYNFFDYNIDALLVRDVSQLGVYYEVMTLPLGTNPAWFSLSFFVVTACKDNTTVEIRKNKDLGVNLSALSSSDPDVRFQVR